jgi:hypothetical protein
VLEIKRLGTKACISQVVVLTFASGAVTMTARGQYSSLAEPWGRVSCLAGRAPCSTAQHATGQQTLAR